MNKETFQFEAYTGKVQFIKMIPKTPSYEQKGFLDAIVAIVYKQNVNTISIGSGVLICKDLVLTAAHNIFSQKEIRKKDLFKVYLGLSEMDQYYQIESWKYLEGIQNRQDLRFNKKNDYALIKLKGETKHVPSNSFPKVVLPCKCILQKSSKATLQIYGFPREKNLEFNGKKNESVFLVRFGLSNDKAIQDIVGDLIHHNISTSPGHSGCPIIYENMIIGIHIGSGGVTYNIGRLVTEEFLKNLILWKNQLHSQSIIYFLEEKKCQICIRDQKHVKVVQNYSSNNVNAKQQLQQVLQYYIHSLIIQRRTHGQYSQEYTQALIGTGSVYHNQKKYAQAIQAFNRTLEIQEKIKGKQSLSIASTLYKLGASQCCQENYSNALDYFKQSLKIREKHKVNYNMAQLHHQIGLVYHHLKQYSLALQQLEYSLQAKLLFKDKESIQLAPTLFYLGQVHKKLGERNQQQADYHYKNALDYYQRALLIYQKTQGKALDAANTFAGIGDIYFLLKNWESSQQSYRKAISIYNQSKDQRNGYAHMKLGQIYYQRKMYRQASQAFQSAIQIYEGVKIPKISRENLLTLGKCYKELSMSKKLLNTIYRYKLDPNLKDLNYQKN